MRRATWSMSVSNAPRTHGVTHLPQGSRRTLPGGFGRISLMTRRYHVFSQPTTSSAALT